MWSRRLVLGVLVLPLALLVFGDGPRFRAPGAELATGPRPPRGLPQPAMVSRRDWHADEKLVREGPHYTGAARAVFVHHTGNPNDYDCADAPGLIRAVQRDHIRQDGWDDIGYNFLVDRCGTIYEGRAGASAARCSARTPRGSTPTRSASRRSGTSARGRRCRSR
ncbi:hypothetical protein SBADM41S_01118 [Streptomyces badius]